MQNKPNFGKAQMNVNTVITKDYENKRLRRLRENKPNSNPNKPNFGKAQMNVTSFYAVEYENKPRFQTPGKQTQPVVSLSNLFQTRCLSVVLAGIAGDSIFDPSMSLPSIGLRAGRTGMWLNIITACGSG